LSGHGFKMLATRISRDCPRKMFRPKHQRTEEAAAGEAGPVRTARLGGDLLAGEQPQHLGAS
jgi:hypothetical protein